MIPGGENASVVFSEINTVSHVLFWGLKQQQDPGRIPQQHTVLTLTEQEANIKQNKMKQNLQEHRTQLGIFYKCTVESWGEGSVVIALVPQWGPVHTFLEPMLMLGRVGSLPMIPASEGRERRSAEQAGHQD